MDCLGADEDFYVQRKIYQDIFIKKLCDLRAEVCLVNFQCYTCLHSADSVFPQEKRLREGEVQRKVDGSSHSLRLAREARQMEIMNNRIGVELVQNRTFLSNWKHEDVCSKAAFDR
jgi:hypothetical protein